MVFVWIIWFTTSSEEVREGAAKRNLQIAAIIVSYVVMELEHRTISELVLVAGLLASFFMPALEKTQLDQIFFFAKLPSSSHTPNGNFFILNDSKTQCSGRTRKTEKREREKIMECDNSTHKKVKVFFSLTFPSANVVLSSSEIKDNSSELEVHFHFSPALSLFLLHTLLIIVICSKNDGKESAKSLSDSIIVRSFSFFPFHSARVGETGAWDEISEIHTNGSRTTYVVTNLLPFTVYSFRILAVNRLGMSHPSKESYYICTLREGEYWRGDLKRELKKRRNHHQSLMFTSSARIYVCCGV